MKPLYTTLFDNRLTIVFDHKAEGNPKKVMSGHGLVWANEKGGPAVVEFSNVKENSEPQRIVIFNNVWIEAQIIKGEIFVRTSDCFLCS